MHQQYVNLLLGKVPQKGKEKQTKNIEFGRTPNHHLENEPQMVKIPCQIVQKPCKILKQITFQVVQKIQKTKTKKRGIMGRQPPD